VNLDIEENNHRAINAGNAAFLKEVAQRRNENDKSCSLLAARYLI
jgi:hypothetical protein